VAAAPAGRIRINYCASLSTGGAVISPAASIGINCADLLFRDGFDPDCALVNPRRLMIGPHGRRNSTRPGIYWAGWFA
jgi:hypothetical protein